jgi:hypothetical protein
MHRGVLSEVDPNADEGSLGGHVVKEGAALEIDPIVAVSESKASS